MKTAIVLLYVLWIGLSCDLNPNNKPLIEDAPQLIAQVENG